MESFALNGVWWTPDNPTLRRYGALYFDPAVGGQLELTIEGKSEVTGFDSSAYHLILGVVDGTAITLKSCRLVNWGSRQSKAFTTRKRVFEVVIIFDGHHFHETEDIQFRALTLGYTHLNEWMGMENFEFTGSFDNPGYSISYTPFQPVILSLTNVDIELGFNHEWPGNDYRTREISLQDKAYISVRPKKSYAYEDIFPYINRYFPTFLTFATGRPNYPIELNGELMDVYETEGVPKKVSIYYAKRITYNEIEPLAKWQMLFCFEDVKEDLNSYFSKWIDLSFEISTVIDLYSRLLYETDLFIDTMFLVLAQALEAYHRSRYGGEYLTRCEYGPIWEDLKIAIDEVGTKQPNMSSALKDKLKAGLEFGYEHSFRKRLKYICQHVLRDHNDIIEAIYGDAELFISRIKATRDNLTHRLDERGPNVLHGLALSDYVIKTKFLFGICLLVEIGLPPEAIKGLLKDNSEYDRARERIWTHL